MTEPAPKYDGQVDVITKTEPAIGKGPNRKGFNVGDYKVIVDTKDLPFTNFDQVDRFLYDIIKFTGDYSGKKKPKDYYIYHPEVMSFIPVKVVEKTQTGGKKKRKRTTKKPKKDGRKRRGTQKV
jgi:hypothetical protein